MFPQMKRAHRRAEQSGRAHPRAPVIPTSFPAATAAASGPGTWQTLLAPDPSGGARALSYHLLADTRHDATAGSGGGYADHDQ
jgi:hypothetical protein